MIVKGYHNELKTNLTQCHPFTCEGVHCRTGKKRTSNIPYIQLKTVVHKRLDIETLGRHNLRDILIRKLFQNCGFP